MNRFRRDILVASATAVVCFAVVVPLGSGSPTQGATTLAGGRQFTVRPESEARFANMDWSCLYQPALPSLKRPRAVICGRESTENGLMVTVTRNSLWVFDCKGLDCRKLLDRPRTP